MKKLTLLLLTFTLSSCSFSFYDVKGVNKKLMPTTQEVYHNKVDNYKSGESCVTNVLYLFTFGDSSIETAAKKGNIKKISSVKTRYEHFVFYLPFFQRGCTIVSGES